MKREPEIKALALLATHALALYLDERQSCTESLRYAERQVREVALAKYGPEEAWRYLASPHVLGIERALVGLGVFGALADLQPDPVSPPTLPPAALPEPQ